MFKDKSLAFKIGGGFGIILILLTFLSFWAINGIKGIVNNAGEVIQGNLIQGEMVQRELDHLNWANSVSALLTDEKITKLNVQKDYRKCGFGKWYYGEGRETTEEFLPQVKSTLNEIEEPHKHLHETAIKIDELFKQANIKLPKFMAEKEVDHLKWVNTIYKCFVNNSPELIIQTDPTKCGLGKFIYGEEAEKIKKESPQLKALLQDIKAPHLRLHESAKKIQKEWKPKHEGLIDILRIRLDDHKNWTIKLAKSIIAKSDVVDLQKDPTRCAFGKFLISEELKSYQSNFPELKTYIKECVTPHEDLHNSALQIEKALQEDNFDKATNIFENKTKTALDSVSKNFKKAIQAENKILKAQITANNIFTEETIPNLRETQKILSSLKNGAENEIEDMNKASHVFAVETKPLLEKVQTLLKKVSDEVRANVLTDEQMLQKASSTKSIIIVVSITIIVIGCFTAFFIARALVTSLKTIITSLNSASAQLSAASSQVSETSQRLAEGSSEQASNLEEISSSLEEMSSMTKQNADNTNQANSMASEAKRDADNGNNAMKKMSSAINEIKKSSDETAKIIKTIDEIAFQTNLLALNAAVEAARAGEAGKGFAVVAEEVRNLAQRSAEAAKNTSTLIEQSQKNSENGVQVTNEVADILGKISTGIQKVTTLINEVTQASKEQAQGIEQVNTAVSQLDQVTQSNAANSEESASASEELSGQAQELKQMVERLTALVEGQAGMGYNNARMTTKEPKSQRSIQKSSTMIAPRGVQRQKVIKPQEVISLDDKDLKDF